MRRRPFLVLTLAVMLLAAGPRYDAQGTRVSLFQVIAVTPSPASRLALRQAITFTFNRRVDCDAAKRALSWTPAIPAATSCDEYSLTFTPAASFQPGSNLEIGVRPPLQAKDGATLREAVSVDYQVAGYLQVAEALPNADGGPAPVDSPITLVFDRPIVPLVMSSERGQLPQPLRIKPATPGSGAWKNSAMYVFTPAESWRSDTRYVVTVADDLTAVDGAALEYPYSWSFQTDRPAILSIDPPQGAANLPLEPRIQLRFNQVMNRGAIERAFFLRPLPESEGDPATGAFEWAEDGRGFAFTPRARLVLDTVYEAGFDPAAATALSFSNLATGTTWRYTSVPPPAIASTTPADGELEVSRGGFSLYFASPMNIASLRDSIKIEPAPELEARVFYNDWNASYTVSFDAEPSTTYRVRIAPGMQDIYGNVISDPYEFSYRTAPRPPLLGLNVPGPVGFYNANRSLTPVDLVYRGVDSIDLALFRLTLPDFITRLTGESRYAPAHDYDPPAAQQLWRRRLDSDTPLNTTRYELLRLTETAALTQAEEAESGLAPGIYFLDLASPDIEGFTGQAGHFLNVANVALTIKQASDRLTIWAVEADSGAPVSGERISVYGAVANVLASGETDDQGIAQLDIPYAPTLDRPLVAVLANAELFGVGYSDWSHGTEPWQFGYAFGYYQRAFHSYVYTDRPVYRTGQPVYFRGIVRSKDDVVYLPPPLESVPVTIRDAHGEIVYQQELELSEFGSFHDIFELTQEAALGAYHLSLDLPAQYEYFSESGGIDFLVAEYRLPEYQVTLSTETPEIAQDAAAAVALEGKYFFGGPVSDALAEYSVLSTPFEFDYTGGGSYDFGDRELYGNAREHLEFQDIVTRGTMTTDAAGAAGFELAGELGEGQGSRRWRIEAGIRDEAGQTIYGSSNMLVHQGLFYLGARAENYVSRAGDYSRIKLIAVDWESRPIANLAVDVEVREQRWISVQEQKPETGRNAWSWDLEEIAIASGELVSGADGKATFSFAPPNGGSFKVIVSARDQRGNLVRSTTFAWVSGGDFVSWRQSEGNTIDLIPDRTDYAVGDQAKVLITSPFQGATEALISIERGDVLSVERLTLNSNSYIYEFDILPQYAPNIYVSVFLLKPVDEFNDVAAWRIGMTQLGVDIRRKALTIDISADRVAAAPQENVRYRLRVTDHEGAPVRAEVGLGLTDLAALTVAERNSPSLLGSFFGPQELSVRSSSSLTVNADAVTAALAEGKGGGGGVLDAGIAGLRGEFTDTPYWNPTLVTDADGEAEIDIHLPDNLTTWRLDARAWTEGRAGDLLVGERTLDLVSTRPLLIRPVTPRYFVVGDRAQLAAVVNNNTDAPVSARVSLENAGGLSLSDGDAFVHELTLPAAGRKRVIWLVDVDDVTSVAPIFVLRSADDAYADASISPVSADFDGTLPVYQYDAPETVGAAGMLRQGGSRSEALLLPRDYEVRDGELRIRLDKSLAGVTTESLTFLEAETRRFRECTSAVVNRFWPNIVSYRAMSELGLSRPALESKLDALVSVGLQELYARQLPAGGWGWCANQRADDMTTAYALIGLAEAAAQGYPVDDAVIKQAQRFLTDRLIRPSLQSEPWQLNRQAFLLYALAHSGAADVARSATLYESRERMNLDAIAFLAQTLHRINPNDRLRLGALRQLIHNRAVTRATGVSFEESRPDRRNWSSNLRTTALALDTLLRLQPESELLPNIARYLLSARDGRGHWHSRQATAWTITALSNWMRSTGELTPSYAFSVALNDDQLRADVALPDNALAAAHLQVDVEGLNRHETNLLEFQRDDGPGVLYYSAHLELDLPIEEVDALSRGIEISRRYTLLDAESDSSISRARIGDAVQVRLQIVVPNTLRYVVIEDHFPAGAEAINPDLATSSQIGAIPGGGSVGADEEGWGWWLFDHIEFRDQKALIYASTLPRGVYEFVYAIRPSIAGEFNVIPPQAQELYFPEVYGRGAGTRFVIEE